MKEVEDQADWLRPVGIMRGIAILAVLVIHVTSIGTELTPAARSWEFYVAANRLASFAVPVFVFLSALSVTYSIINRPQRPWRDFYARRWWRVGMPYLIWSGIYLLYRFWWLKENPEPLHTPPSWLEWGFLGTSYYHLYYLPIVIQLYLFFPLLLAINRWRPWRFGAFVGLFSLAGLIFWEINRLYLYSRFPFTATLLASYLPLLATGIWLGAHAREWPEWWRAWRLPSLLLTVVGGSAYWWLYRSIFAGEPVNDYIVEVAWGAFSTGVAMLFLGLANRAVPDRFWTALLARLGSASFSIYLLHPLLLNEWQRLIPAGAGMTFHLNILGSFLFIFTVSWGATLVLRRLAQFVNGGNGATESPPGTR